MTSSDFKAAIEARLSDVFNAEQQAALTLEARLMIERMSTLVLRAGKRSRPRLLLLTYQAYGGKHPETLIDIGVGLELQHQFLLVHDDIMDNDTVRYDGPNLLGYYRQEYPANKSTIADSMALMAGNLLFTFACRAILNNPDLSADKKVAILSLIQKTNIAVHAGQQLDVVNILALDPKIDDKKLLLTDYLKTAVYSILQPMQVAAELLDIDQAERKKIDNLARTAGVLYQLVDDYSDYFVNDSSFENHPKYRDFRQGKLTHPLLLGLKLANTQDKEFLQQYAGDKSLADATMRQVAEILKRCGAETAAKKQIDDYYQRSLGELEQLKIDSEAHEAFVAMLESFRI